MALRSGAHQSLRRNRAIHFRSTQRRPGHQPGADPAFRDEERNARRRMREHGAMSGADQLHETLVRDIRAAGSAWREPVHQALRAVRRHLFVPEVPLEEAYAVRSAVVTKRDPHGVPLSSASAPSIVALMLDQLDVRPGQRVLEIGSGTGYNAALLAELTGPTGQVVTVDGSSLAFFTHRRLDGTEPGRSELGAIGVGPSGAGLAQVVAHHIRAWDTRRDVLPQLTAYPAGTPDDVLPDGAVTEKHHTRLVVTYPPTPAPP
jgi:hypothetical protein